MRARDLTIRSAAILILLTVAAILVHGYHPGVEDDFVYLPAIKHNLNPALYPHDADFFRLQLQATVFDKVVAWSVRLTHVPLDWALLAWQAAAIFLVLLGCWKIARRCFAETHARWAGVALIAALLTMPVAGTSLFLVDQHLHPRALATAFVLFAIVAVLDGRRLRALLWVAIAFAFHPIMAAFGASYCVFLVWPTPRGAPSFEGEGGTHVASKASTLATQGWGTQGRRSALVPIGFVPKLAALAAFIPLGWIFEQPTAAWREAAATRSYYFLGRQEWYEWLGTLAPLVILWGFSRIRTARSSDGQITQRPNCAMAFMSRRLVWFAIFQFAVTLAIMLPPQIERFRTLQPLRYLHLVYVLMLLFVGGLIGKYVLRAKAWRWAALFLPIALGMFLAQRAEFPGSAHVEFGRAADRNPWVQAFHWVRDNTPQDAYFALGPKYYEARDEDWHSFRALAERSQLADALKDPSVSTQVPRLAVRWQRESHAQDGWEHFRIADFERLKQHFGVNWVVLDHEVHGMECPFTTGADAKPIVRVCRVP